MTAELNLDLINNYKEAKLKLNEQLEKNGKEIIKLIFKEIFNRHPGTKLIKVIAWTPGFNDGEPCVHQQEVMTGTLSWINKDGTKYYDFCDRDEEETFDYNKEEDTHINSACETLSQVETDVNEFEEILRKVYETNFQLVVRLKDNGEVTIDSDYYDCGY